MFNDVLNFCLLSRLTMVIFHHPNSLLRIFAVNQNMLTIKASSQLELFTLLNELLRYPLPICYFFDLSGSFTAVSAYWHIPKMLVVHLLKKIIFMAYVGALSLGM